MNAIETPAEVIPIGCNSVAFIQASIYLCKLFYWASQELFTWIKELFIIYHEVFWKKKSSNSILASIVFQELGLGLFLLSTIPMPKYQSSLSVWWICSLQEFHCILLMAGYKTGFMMLFSTSIGILIHWFIAWNWRESKLALSVIQHVTVKRCSWCKCILNLV